MTSGLESIAESAAKDDKRLTRRLVKLMEELNMTVQPAERSFDLAHNAQGGIIRLPDKSHNQAIHQAVRQLLEGAGSADLMRRFHETFVKMNQIITVSGVVVERYTLTQASGNTGRNESP